MQQVWRERLKDSSWVTIAWDWFQTLLGRAVEGILWVTMVFSCYQLIPFAPQAPVSVSTFMFILQFIGLDVGGIGLNKLAQGQGLYKWSFVRVVSYILIGITLVTVAYAGVERAVKIDASTTYGIEVALVVARSIMTVLYGQAIHSLKQQTKSVHSFIGELQERVDTLRSQLDTEQQRASMLQKQLDTKQQEVSTLHSHLSSGQGEVSRLHSLLDTEQQRAFTLQAQLDMRQQEVSTLQGSLSSGQGEASRLENALDTERERTFTLQKQLDTRQHEVDILRQSLANTGQTKEVSSGQREVDTEKTARVIRLDTSRLRKSGQDATTADNALVEQIRQLLGSEPGLSGRAIAARLGCSPTTAGKWKTIIEQESIECMNE